MQTHTPPSPMSSRHSSQDSLHKNTLGGSGGYGGPGMLVGGPGGVRDVSAAAAVAAAAAAQKKKGIKSSLGRFFSKKEKVYLIIIIIIYSVLIIIIKTGERKRFRYGW